MVGVEHERLFSVASASGDLGRLLGVGAADWDGVRGGGGVVVGFEVELVRVVWVC